MAQDRLASREEHVQFWRALAGKLKEGVPLVDALNAVAGQMEDTPYRVTARTMAQGIESGASLSETMSGKPAKFTDVLKALVRAGESGGALDVAADRIAEAIEAGDICPLGCEPAAEREVRWWRLLALMVSSGVPLVEALGKLRADIAWGEMNEALGAIRHAVTEGRSFSEAARQFPSLFPAGVCNALSAAEAEGRFHEALQ
ncbi:MAG: type II secretion system F family protein, partial [Candidatus Brocadiia bacterium]